MIDRAIFLVSVAERPYRHEIAVTIT